MIEIEFKNVPVELDGWQSTAYENALSNTSGSSPLPALSDAVWKRGIEGKPHHVVVLQLDMAASDLSGFQSQAETESGIINAVTSHVDGEYVETREV